MIDFAEFDRRPMIVAITGPNGSGKTTFYHTYLSASGLRFVNADVLAAELLVEPYAAARLANALRRTLLGRGESFVFETVFSDPVGDKVAFLEEAVGRGYEVAVCYIGLADATLSAERVAMRTLKGGHDVPGENLQARFPRTLNNLREAIIRLPHVLVYDNSDLMVPFRPVAVFKQGRLCDAQPPIPAWLQPMIP